MRNWRATGAGSFVVACFLLIGGTAWGAFFIPYHLKTRSLTAPGKYEVFPVWLVLADHYSRFFGAQDELKGLLLQTKLPEDSPFIRRFLKQKHRWYTEQVAKYPKIYGANPGPIIEGMKKEEPPTDGRSSFMVFGQPILLGENDALPEVIPDDDEAALEAAEPAAIFRVSMPGLDGLLPSERHFQGKGLAGPFPQLVEPQFEWVKVPTLRSPFKKGTFRLSLPIEEENVFWLSGGKIEIKNYCLDPEFSRKLYPRFVAIAARHKLLDYSGQPLPDSVTHYPNGDPIPEGLRRELGMLASVAWTDNYGAILKRDYTALGLSEYKQINNTHTYGLDLFFMNALMPTFKNRWFQRASARAEGEAFEDWLVFDAKLAARLKAQSRKPRKCSRRLDGE